jgi:cbb3-type cytochrome oxidase subunit 3
MLQRAADAAFLDFFSFLYAVAVFALKQRRRVREWGERKSAAQNAV